MWRLFFSWFVKITGWLPWTIACRTKVYYQNKRVQSRKIKGKAIIISNHRSVYDFAMMLFLFPCRTLRCMIAEVMFRKNPLFSFFLKSLGGSEVDRESHDFSFVQKGYDILQKNGVVEIYPESRLPEKGEQTPLPFKPSTAYMALLSQAPVIPVFTNGCYFKKKRNKVLIGTPVNVWEWYDETLSEKVNLENITNRLRDTVIELQNEFERRENTKENEKA